MNKIVTSRAEILKTAKELALSGGLSELSIRSVANACGISIGSVYNYFEKKTDLVIAVVAEVWQDILRPALWEEEAGFLGLVERIGKRIEEGMKAYPAFFTEHAVRIDDKEKGRAVMENYFRHRENVLLAALLRDELVRPDAWTEEFRPEDLVGFVFDFWRMELMEGRLRIGFLEELLRRAVY